MRAIFSSVAVLVTLTVFSITSSVITYDCLLAENITVPLK